MSSSIRAPITACSMELVLERPISCSKPPTRTNSTSTSSKLRAISTAFLETPLECSITQSGQPTLFKSSISSIKQSLNQITMKSTNLIKSKKIVKITKIKNIKKFKKTVKRRKIKRK